MYDGVLGLSDQLASKLHKLWTIRAIGRLSTYHRVSCEAHRPGDGSFFIVGTSVKHVGHLFIS